MKPVLSVFFILLVVIIAIHHSSASMRRMNKRYYDAWSSDSDTSGNGNGDSVRTYPYQQKSFKKEDPCSNKPLWYLKYQARLGKLSPFYDCLSVHGI